MDIQAELDVVAAQPRLWVEAMLDEYDTARAAHAKHAILARVGVVLFSLYGLHPEPRILEGTPRTDAPEETT